MLCTQKAPERGALATAQICTGVLRMWSEQQEGSCALVLGGLGAALLQPAVVGWSHSCQRRAIIRHKHMLMAAKLQKPFFCPLEPDVEDDHGFVTDCDSEIERRWHALLRAARGPSAPGQLGFYSGVRFSLPEIRTVFIPKTNPPLQQAREQRLIAARGQSQPGRPRTTTPSP